MWIAARGCVRTDDVAKVLGISRYTAKLRLSRLRRRGVLRVVWKRRTAWWCVPGAEPPVAPRVVPRRRQKTAEVLEETEELLVSGCVTTSVLMNRFGISHTQAFYALRMLQAEGRVVETTLGKVALWCRDRDAAQKFVEELRGEVARLVDEGRLRYVTPKRLFELIVRDARAREVFSRVINVKSPPSVSAYSVLRTLLELMYGEPVARSIYYTAQTSNNINIDIKYAAGERIAVVLTPDLAETLVTAQNIDNLVLQALEQLLQRYRT
jgi:hypothetical protein